MSIKTVSLSHQFNNQSVLNGISLDIPTGSCCALIGANGSGKTTLLKILSGIITPSSGTVLINGTDIQQDSCAIRASQGCVFNAEQGFYQMLTVYENMRFFAALYGVSGTSFEERFVALTAQFDIDSYKDTRMDRCPSGIRQRCALIRALIHSPTILIIDELNRSIDSEMRPRLIDYIKKTITAQNNRYGRDP